MDSDRSAARAGGFSSTVSSAASRLWRRASEPDARVEIGVWVFLVLLAIGVRLYVLHLVPGYIWTRDSQSYAAPVFHWLDTGEWITDGRRGPTYSAFIALAVKTCGSVMGVVWIQHAMGALAVLAAAVVLRVWFGRRAIVPIALCGGAYAIYSLPLTLEQLVRNETLLLFCGTAALAGWALFLKKERAAWLVLSGVGVGVLTLTKNIYVPFVPVVCALLIWRGFRRPLALAGWLACFILAAASPAIANKVFNATLAAGVQPPRPQDGILFYGRTAQFTKLDGGIAPDIKALVRPDVEAYRKRTKLDNNFVIYRSIVPKIRQRFHEEKKSDVELNRLCFRLALEAIREHPGAYSRQVALDLWRLLANNGRPERAPGPSDVKSGIAKLKIIPEPHPAMNAGATLAALEGAKDLRRFHSYHRLIRFAWLFALSPVLLTTLLLPWHFWRTRRSDIGLFWLALASVWFFTLVLLSSVGRPLERYLIPVAPIMFWTLSATVMFLWEWFAAARRPRAPAAESSRGSSEPPAL